MTVSSTLTSDFFYSPHYKTQCVTLNAQAAAVPRGTIVCVKSSMAFSGVAAHLSGDEQSYTPEGSISPSAGASDGTFDIVGSAGYGEMYGVLLDDAPASESAQGVQVIVAGELFKAYMDAVYKAAHSGTSLSSAQLVELRKLGIILK